MELVVVLLLVLVLYLIAWTRALWPLLRVATILVCVGGCAGFLIEFCVEKGLALPQAMLVTVVCFVMFGIDVRLNPRE